MSAAELGAVPPPCSCTMSCPACQGELSYFGGGEEWAVVGHDHSIEAKLQDEAEAEIARIRAAMLAATTGPVRSRGPMPSDIEINFYMVHSNWGTWSFRNRIRHADLHEEGCTPVAPMPWCCGMPMQYTPKGWKCRETPAHPHLHPAVISDERLAESARLAAEHDARMAGFRRQASCEA